MKALMTLYLRLALGISFLSSVADRFGIWGAPGKPNVVWGNIENYTDYVAALTPFIPNALVPIAGWIATMFETILGILLIIGFKTRITAVLSGAMLIIFALGLTVGTGFKTSLDYSVFSASAGAFILIYFKRIPYSIDALLMKKTVEAESFSLESDK
ncbi:MULTISPECIES: MauE/DoxX family redox-associated membrane protein [Bacillus amyloliquefaciens group]|uniref:MauE/DoxX family redox-associated membrane protein n=1 Tax=Bacillus amyloliquefaciens group TaxID=1938374 RepID=UPI0009B0C091|nr:MULTISPECIES: DoxX family membrane protein [Bacillus amyloliquefaciens group]ARJ73939.1 DoxX protein [Bacillus velezensis]MEA1006586.1 DoxX family membrane protein [Bacillus velezensis]MEC1107794.1 DoxX family membrane protein [Bacillus velezensis]OQC78216.1 DoxX protein [Bacillus velezensis]QZT41456.1 DoxX family membrane protein [Bacillus amyloliquefaciens]